jgi:hypothetical protein
MIGSLLADRCLRTLSFHAIFISCHVRCPVALLSVADLAQYSYRRMLLPDQLQGRITSVFRLIS